MILHRQIIRLASLLLLVKSIKAILNWWKTKKFLQAQSHIAPFIPEFGSTPLSLATSFGSNSKRANDFRLDIVKKYTNDFTNNTKTVTGCGVLFPWSTIVLTIDKEVVQHVLKDSFNTYLRMDIGFEVVFGPCLLTSNHGPLADDKGKFFKYQRKTASKLFTDKILTGLVASSVLKHANNMMNALQKHVDSGSNEGFTQKTHIYAYAFGIMCEVGFGHTFDTLEELLKYQHCIETMGALVPNHILNPFWKLPYCQKYVPSKIELVSALSLLTKFCYKIIDARVMETDDQRNTRGDLLSLFINSSKDNVYGREQLKDLTLMFLGAGGDTSANTMHWLTYHLAADHSLQEEIYENTRHLFRIDETTGEFVIDANEVKKNMFLDGVVMESLRLHPPLTLNGKVAAQDDMLPNGLEVKKGTTVMFDAYAMGRNATRFPDPDKFLPARWMSSSRKSEVFDEYELPVFLGGNRVCIGKALAVQEIKIFLIALVNKFKIDFHPDEAASIAKRDVLYGDAFINGYNSDLLITAVERKPK